MIVDRLCIFGFDYDDYLNYLLDLVIEDYIFKTQKMIICIIFY